jgi:uncharacterized membrane protein YraQ (UPF0718 family)
VDHAAAPSGGKHQVSGSARGLGTHTDNPLAIPAAAVLGTPLYVSTEAFLPIAATLHANGMGLGAVIP